MLTARSLKTIDGKEYCFQLAIFEVERFEKCVEYFKELNVVDSVGTGGKAIHYVDNLEYIISLLDKLQKHGEPFLKLIKQDKKIQNNRLLPIFDLVLNGGVSK